MCGAFPHQRKEALYGPDNNGILYRPPRIGEDSLMLFRLGYGWNKHQYL